MDTKIKCAPSYGRKGKYKVSSYGIFWKDEESPNKNKKLNEKANFRTLFVIFKKSRRFMYLKLFKHYCIK